jgi:hypothetical protein
MKEEQIMELIQVKVTAMVKRSTEKLLAGFRGDLETAFKESPEIPKQDAINEYILTHIATLYSIIEMTQNRDEIIQEVLKENGELDD